MAEHKCFLLSCEQRFRTREEMYQHFREAHTSENRPFHCGHCGMNFNKAEHCRTHMRTVADIHFVCHIDNCRTKFHDRSNVIRHIRQKHPEHSARARDIADVIVNKAHDKFLRENRNLPTDLKVVRAPAPPRNKCSVKEIIPHRIGSKVALPNSHRVQTLMHILDPENVRPPPTPDSMMLNQPLQANPNHPAFRHQQRQQNPFPPQATFGMPAFAPPQQHQPFRDADGDALMNDFDAVLNVLSESSVMLKSEPMNMLNELEKSAPFGLAPNQHESAFPMQSGADQQLLTSRLSPASTASASVSPARNMLSAAMSEGHNDDCMMHDSPSPTTGLKITLPEPSLSSFPKSTFMSENSTDMFGMFVGGMSPIVGLQGTFSPGLPRSPGLSLGLSPRLSGDPLIMNSSLEVPNQKPYYGLGSVMGLPISPVSGLPVSPGSGLPMSPMLGGWGYLGHSKGTSNSTQSLQKTIG